MDLSDYLKRIIAHVMKKAVYYGLFKYRVTEQAADKVSLKAVNQDRHFPDQLFIKKAHGLQGVSEMCAEGSHVLVGFEGGDPGRPYVAHYLDGTPRWVNINATQPLGIKLGTITGVHNPLQPIALAPGVSSAFAAVFAQESLNVSALMAIYTWMANQTGPNLVAAQTAIAAAGAGLTSLGTSLTTYASTAPVGYSSAKTESE